MKTCDICDAYESTNKLQVAEPVWRDFGGVIEFGGEAYPVKAFEDNSLVRSALEKPGKGRVLVIDSGGSRRCAMLGGNLAVMAADNGWSGVVVNGCVRDSEELAAANVAVKALGTHPRRSMKRGEGQDNVTVGFAGITINPGDFIYGDEDGLLVTTEAVSLKD